MKKLDSYTIETAIASEVSREKYSQKMIELNYEIVDFDSFLENIAEIVNENDGDIDDAVLIATDAFLKL